MGGLAGWSIPWALGSRRQWLTNLVDAVGTTKFTYSNGLLASEIGPWTSSTVTYSYNNARLRSGFSLAQPGGATPLG